MYEPLYLPKIMLHALWHRLQVHLHSLSVCSSALYFFLFRGVNYSKADVEKQLKDGVQCEKQTLLCKYSAPQLYKSRHLVLRGHSILLQNASRFNLEVLWTNKFKRKYKSAITQDKRQHEWKGEIQKLNKTRFIEIKYLYIFLDLYTN